jgi:manganese transport protein
VIAIVPAVIAITILGEKVSGKMLILSQVILSLQLGFAIIPMIHFVSDRKKMGIWTISLKIKILSWICALVIIALNIQLIINEISSWLSASNHPTLLLLILIPILIGFGFLLVYVTFQPLWARES